VWTVVDLVVVSVLVVFVVVVVVAPAAVAPAAAVVVVVFDEDDSGNIRGRVRTTLISIRGPICVRPVWTLPSQN